MRFPTGFNKVAIELQVVQFWSEIILVISNQTRAARSFDFEITRMISDQIALQSVQLPLLITFTKYNQCSSRKYKNLPQGRDFFSKTPHPSGNSNKASHISLNLWVLQIPHPQEVPIPSVGGVWIFSGHAQ